MMCHSRPRTHFEARAGDIPPDEVVRQATATRVGDADRDAVLRLLADAFAEGRLTKAEFDDRGGDALVARTGDDLSRLTADLPLSDRMPVRSSRGRTPAPGVRSLPADVAAYARVMALMLGIWFAVAVSTTAWYPWFVWPALGWGIPVVARAVRQGSRIVRG